MNTKKLIAIALILILVFSLASCGKTDDSNNDEIQGTLEVDEGNGVEDENIAEEEEEDDNGDPPFVKMLRTGVYGYETRNYFIWNGKPVESHGFVYSDGSRAVYGMLADDGDGEFELVMRDVYDYEENVVYHVFDDFKQYSVNPDANNLFHTMLLPDFRSGQSETGRGTTDCYGETLDYIDYGSDKDAVRLFIKDGDVYAMQAQDDDNYTRYPIKTYSSPPTTQYFEIPDDYEPAPRR